jgi:hypothetical protein
MALTFIMFAMFALFAQSPTELPGRNMTLLLPHSLAQGESAWIVVKVGSIGNAEIEVTTPSGRSLGTISPFGIRTGNEAGTYTLPLPLEVISDGHVTVRLSLTQYSRERRAPTKKEVRGVRIKIQPVTR